MSELHNRLKHLVNYSSQLIFVSGDTVADQQRTLSDFLASQQENTEISFISASDDKQASDYRSAICRQLAGHTVGSFVRPLNQLLADLSANDGPYLVCITGADCLSESFLQELWDWVMHSQQGQENIHLNVILFGKSSWAESSQDWLPSQNSHKPVLLSSQSVNSAGFDVNALEALMANDSNWFNFSSKPLVTNKWFIGGVLSVFLATFVGLISWQYPQEVNQLLTQGVISSLDDKQELPVFDLPTQSNDQTDKTAIVDLNTLTAPQNQTENTNDPYLVQLELIEDNSEVSKLVDSEVETDTPSAQASTSLTDTLLVSTWQEGISTKNYVEGTKQKKRSDTPSDSAITELINDTSVQDELASASLNNSALNKSALNNTNRETKTSEAVQGDQDGDFKVPDIISVEQLDRQLASELSTQASAQISAEQFVDTSNSIGTEQNTSQQVSFTADTLQGSSDKEQAQALSSSNQQPVLNVDNANYRFDESTLLNLPTDAILLQLSGIQNPVVLENYLASNDLKANTWIYETERYGGPWYVVVYRQSFDSIDAALGRMSSLPASVRDAEPFAKSVNQIQQEIKLR